MKILSKLLDPKKRFSDRVENYIKYRPRYPESLIKLLEKEIGLNKDCVIADIGSGTGILAKLFLKNVNKVYGIEPNKEMRNAAEKLYKNHPNFISIDGAAEFTKLEAESVDIITAGQAFHWFDISKAKKEFKKVLKKEGYIVLLWNKRKKSDPFHMAYEKLLKKYGTDYKQVCHIDINSKALKKFYSKGKSKCKKIINEQVLNFEGLKGRLLSASYIPGAGHPRYKEMIGELKKIFDKYKRQGKVRIKYDTEVWWGKIN